MRHCGQLATRGVAAVAAALACLLALLAPLDAFAAPPTCATSGLALGDPSPLAARAEGASGASLLGYEGEDLVAVATGTFHQSEARRLLALLNETRAAAGSAPLAWSYDLELAAMQRAVEISYLFEHERPDATSCFTVLDGLPLSAMGENILKYWGSGQRADAQRANDSWAGSPGHYANMVSTNFTTVGVACFELDGGFHWVELFGRGVPGSPVEGVAFDESGSFAFEVAPAYISLGVWRDYDASRWYAADLVYSANNLIMTGYSGAPYFGIGDEVTRGQVATSLWRMAGSPTVSAPRYSDVDYDAYYGDAISWARATGVISGYGDNRFDPDRSATRQEVAAMVTSFASRVAGVDTSSDGSALAALDGADEVPAWARESMEWAVDRGIVRGVEAPGGTMQVRPGDTTTRETFAVIATRLHRDVLGM